VRGHQIEVDMGPAETTYRLLAGTGIPIKHFDETLRLLPGESLSLPAPGTTRDLPRAA
jgi:hypothetical protein